MNLILTRVPGAFRAMRLKKNALEEAVRRPLEKRACGDRYELRAGLPDGAAGHKRHGMKPSGADCQGLLVDVKRAGVRGELRNAIARRAKAHVAPGRVFEIIAEVLAAHAGGFHARDRWRTDHGLGRLPRNAGALRRIHQRRRARSELELDFGAMQLSDRLGDAFDRALQRKPHRRILRRIEPSK